MGKNISNAFVACAVVFVCIKKTKKEDFKLNFSELLMGVKIRLDLNPFRFRNCESILWKTTPTYPKL